MRVLGPQQHEPTGAHRHELPVSLKPGEIAVRVVRPGRQGVQRRVADLLDAIVGGMTQAEIEPDRATAIRRAVVEAGEHDVVLLAGKGHETYQIVGTDSLPFDDVEVLREAARALGGEAAS